jgi:hypothetical protein
MKKILIAIIFIYCNTLVYAQVNSHIVRNNTYKNKKYGFSFLIPGYLKIATGGDESYYKCIAITPIEKKKHAVNRGAVFIMEVSTTPLDSTLSVENYEKHADGEYYINTPLNDSVKANKIKGVGWTGLQETHVCRGGTTTQSNGDVTSEILDGCENVYLSNGKITIKIYTDGKKLDDKLYAGILKSLRF